MSTKSESVAIKSPNVVSSYFANADNAHRAIEELLDQGFNANEIGAAFHSIRKPVERERDAEQDVNTNISFRSAAKLDSSIAGPASGTGGVTPAGLSTGAGPVIAGASAPGPIPGSKIPASIPRTIQSELPSEASLQSSSSPRAEDARDWRCDSRVGHLFSDNKGIQAQDAKDSQNFGTGEGHLELSDYPYSMSAFESAFSGMGVAPDHARWLSAELKRGGAIITVNTSDTAQAAAILERNHGVLGLAASTESNGLSPQDDPNARVEVFGELHRIYPRYTPADEIRARKAS